MAQIRDRMVREHNERVEAARNGIPAEMVEDERRKAREALEQSKRRGLRKRDKTQKPGPADW